MTTINTKTDIHPNRITLSAVCPSSLKTVVSVNVYLNNLSKESTVKSPIGCVHFKFSDIWIFTFLQGKLEMKGIW